ncbi:MAG: trimeric intracellular cation channel family protein [Desulfomonile tiedjei]|nr:trimeric intracellular cation channel family protein [Desulfomonile tiedjei]
MPVIYYLNLFGTAVFAVGGAMAAARKGMDLFGVVVAAVLTGIGGGTLRDLCLGVRPVNWVTDCSGLEISVVFGILTFAYLRLREPAAVPGNLLNVADAVGLAVFTVLGCKTALANDAGLLITVIMGMLTGSGGGIIRDVFSAEIPLFFRKEIYATACLAGGSAYLALSGLRIHEDWAMLGGAAVTLGIRLAAIRWGLSLPALAPTPAEADKT